MPLMAERPGFVFSAPLAYSIASVTADPSGGVLLQTVEPPSSINGLVIAGPERSLTRFLEKAIVEHRAQEAASPHSLVVNTNFGCAAEAKDYLRNIHDKGFHYASPLRFPFTVNSSLLGGAARALRIEGEAALLVGENAACLGADLLDADAGSKTCACISVEAVSDKGGGAQYCSMLTLYRECGVPWRPLVGVLTLRDSERIHRCTEAMLDKVGGTATALFAGPRDSHALLSLSELLLPRLHSAYICSVEGTAAGGSFLLYFLSALADSLSPDDPIVVISSNRLSVFEILCLGAPASAPMGSE